MTSPPTPPAPPSSKSKRQPGCTPCRERHVKCDKERPTCSRCREAKYDARCEYGARSKPPLRFRRSQYTSAASQLFPGDASPKSSLSRASRRAQASALPASEAAADFRRPSLEGEEHTDSLGAENYQDYGISSARKDEAEAEAGPHSELQCLDFHVRADAQAPPAQDRRSEVLWLSPLGTTSTLDDTSTHDHTQGSRIRGNGSAFPGNSLSRVPSVTTRPNTAFSPYTGLPADDTPRILTDDLERKIFDFYITQAGYWLDIGSPGRYFQTSIPQLALLEPLVYYACLACSSNIMSLMGMVEKSTENLYNDKVLQLLIPLLSSKEHAASSNEALLATTVILRMSEQFLEADSDAQRHLNGAALLFMDGNTKWSPVESSLSIACFWTHLRETIRICFLHERPSPFDLSHLGYADEEMTTPATDEAWTNRITSLLLRVCAVCWATDVGTFEARRKESQYLSLLIEKWKEHLPLSFRPWYVRASSDSNGGPFPHIRYLSSWHVVAWQFYYTAKVMLAVQYSNGEGGETRYSLGRVMESEIIWPTRWLCGLCMSSTENTGTNLNGSHLMAWCGQFLFSQVERKCLLEFLSDFGQRTKWPNQTSCKRLNLLWKSLSRSWNEC